MMCLLLVFSPVSYSRGPPILELQPNGSVIFSLAETSRMRSFISYIPANPEYQPIDGEGFLEVQNLTVSIDRGAISGLAVSYEAGKKWTFDGRNRQFSEMDMAGGRNRMRILRRYVSYIFSITYDSVNKVLYWTQMKYRTIGAMDADGNRFVTIGRFQTLDPRDIAIHLTKRKLFFAVTDLPSRSVTATQLVKSDLDGGNMIRVLGYPSVILIQGLTIDHEGDRIFWTDLSIISSSFAVFSSGLNGEDKRQIFSVPNTNLWGVGVVDGYVYAANYLNNSNNEYFIYRSKKDGGSVTSLKLRLRPRYIAVYAPSEPDVSTVPHECHENRCDHLCVASEGGNHACKCSDGYRVVDGYKCNTIPIENNYLIVTDIAHMSLFKIPLNETAQANAYAVSTEDVTKTRIYAMHVEGKTGDLIFYKEDFGDRRVIWGDKSIPFDGDVGSIVVHCCKDIVYWITQENIYSWDGKSDNYIVLDYTFEFFIKIGMLHLEVDCVADHLYWLEYSSFFEKGSLKRSDLKGQNVEIVLDNLPISMGMTIDYETYTLHVVNTVDFEIYSLPLPLTDITNTSAYQYNITSFSSILSEESQPLVKDIQVINGSAYLFGLQGIQKFAMGEKQAALERFGPYIFHNVPTAHFYDTAYYKRFIEPICEKPSATTEAIHLEKSEDNCRDILEKALSASTDDYISLLHVYLRCVIKSLLPALQ